MHIIMWSLSKKLHAGYESAEPIILQGHLDMVCEKKNDTEIDFENEGLRLFYRR